MEGLGSRRVLRIARDLLPEASARSLIFVSCEASFSVSLEAGSSTVHRPLPRPTLPTARHVSLMLQPLPQSQPDGGSTPQDGRRDPRSHQCHTGRDRARRGLLATVSYHCDHDQRHTGWDRVRWGLPATVSYHCVHDQHHTGWDGVRRGLPATVSKRCTHDWPPAQGLGTVHRGLGDLGVRACRDPPPQYKPRHRPSLSLAHSPSTVACTFAATSTPRHSQGSHDAQDLMGRPRRPSTPRMDHSDDHAATGTGHRARMCHPYWHDAA
jgi:hypothetical protein